MQKWEYQVVVRVLVDTKYQWADEKDKRSPGEMLNALGEEGWELVAAHAALAYLGTKTVSHVHYILKRPVSETAGAVRKADSPSARISQAFDLIR
jgi:Domain of unknown function (DUF4177)